MIFEYLDKLRDKPEEKRKKFVFIFSVSITAVIFLFWLAFFDFDIGGGLATTTPSVRDLSPVKSFMEIFKGFKESLPAILNK